ncbi:MAG TPA: hypothetical protein PKD84_04235 [Propionicimonas sp.]|nr:hypothetical protein [Propionicimonas sp.]
MNRFLSAVVAATVTLTGWGVLTGEAHAQGVIQPTATTLVKTVKVDVDGDKRPDRVRIYRLGATSWRVAVTTARKKSASIKLTSDPNFFVDSWNGAAKLDGAPGYELMVNLHVSDGGWFDVLTWRSNRLVKEKAPASAPNSTGNGWYVLGMGDSGEGFHLFSSKGRRYVDRGSWYCQDFEAPCTASVTRSVWRSGRWRAVKRFTRRGLSMKQTERYIFTGVKVVGR